MASGATQEGRLQPSHAHGQLTDGLDYGTCGPPPNDGDPRLHQRMTITPSAYVHETTVHPQRLTISVLSIAKARNVTRGEARAIAREASIPLQLGLPGHPHHRQ